jgi:hypothetical protein
MIDACNSILLIVDILCQTWKQVKGEVTNVTAYSAKG